MRYTKNRLEKLAEDVVRTSKSSGDSLVDSVLSVLKDNPMNPEQIRRLVEMTNTSKFLDEFSDTSGDDRFVDFDVLDPEDIIKRFLGAIPDGAKVDSKSKSLAISMKKVPGGTLVTKRESNTPGLDTEDSEFFSDIEETKEKSAFFHKIASQDLSFTDKYNDSPAWKGDQANLPDEIQKKILKSKGKELAKNNNNKKKKLKPHDEKRIEEKLHTKKEAASYECDHLASVISSKFKGIYSRDKHAGFEIEALANYGLDSLPALQAVRAKLGMDLLSAGAVTESQVKKASERYLSDKSSVGMLEVGKYIGKTSSYIEACLELDAFYSYTKGTEKTASIGSLFGKGLSGAGAIGGIVTVGGLLSNPTKTTSYILDKQMNSWDDRIQARDTALKTTLDRVTNFAIQGLEDRWDNKMDELSDRNVDIERKGRRLSAAKELMKNNPDLRSAGASTLMSAINMVGKVAPELSTSVPFLTAHVKQMVYNSDGGSPVIDAQSIKSMSDAERAFENLGKFKPA